MNVRQLSKHIYYLGVNDMRTHRFEGLWPIPKGVSYNSYLINDDKPAVIDAVEIGFCKDLIDNMHDVLGNKSPEYLIINHMEPDHSGSIPVLMDVFPNLKIVGNKQTAEMIKGFYSSIDMSRMVIVGDGDEISLGKTNLRFVLTPMVHWPETMMTYFEEEATLFSGDAFGTFGAINGMVVDNEIDLNYYIDEMYRYYSNIVGKYGRFVQRALEKVKSSGISLSRICTTHGPVWEKEIGRVVELYDKLSRYEASQGVVVAYGSMYGNTAEAANAIASELADNGVKEVRVHDLSASNLSYVLSDIFKFNGLIIASPTYSMDLFPPVEALMKALVTREVKHRTFGVLGSYTWAPGIILKKISHYSDLLGWNIEGYVEMKQAMKASTLKEIKSLAAKVASEVLK